MEALDTLNGKVNALIKKCATAEAENKRLKDTLAAQEKTLQAQTKKLASLEQDMVSVRLGSAVDNEDAKDNMREQLDNVISEIDKILHTLND